MILSTVILWFACLIVFISSPHQTLLKKPLDKRASWLIFVLLVFVSRSQLSMFFPVFTAELIILASIMLMWITMVLAHGHLKLKLFPFSVLGGAIFTTITLIGA